MPTNEKFGRLLPPAIWQALAAEYEEQPEDCTEGWNLLITHTRIYAEKVAAGLTVVCTPHVCVERFEIVTASKVWPYETTEEIIRLVEAGAYLKPKGQSGEFSHPIFIEVEWLDYLLWHDLTGHAETGFAFTPEQEVLAFRRHTEQCLSLDLRLALFTQQILPIAHAIVTGSWIDTRAPVPGPITAELVERLGRRS